MIDLVELVDAALKNIKAEAVDNEFGLSDICREIHRLTRQEVEAEARFMIPKLLSKRRDIRPLSSTENKWIFGSYTPPLGEEAASNPLLSLVN